MSNVQMRDLSYPQAAHSFLVQELGYPPEADGTIAAAQAIALAESSLPKAGSSAANTLNERKKRHKAVRTDVKRGQLHNVVIRELFHQPRLESDDDICLGPSGGGCRPAQLDFNKQAYLVIGPPAAGKSSICGPVADAENALIIDSDYAKRKLPEYSTGGAGLVHEESQLIIEGDPENGHCDCLLDRALDQGANIVYPRVGRDLPDIMSTIDRIRASGYDVHLLVAHCSPREAALRAMHRFLSSPDRRYVPLGYIYDIVSQHPLVNYLQLRMQNVCTSFEAYDNGVPKGEAPRRIADWSDGDGARIPNVLECDSETVEYAPIKGFEKRREVADVPEINTDRVRSSKEKAE